MRQFRSLRSWKTVAKANGCTVERFKRTSRSTWWRALRRGYCVGNFYTGLLAKWTYGSLDIAPLPPRYPPDTQHFVRAYATKHGLHFARTQLQEYYGYRVSFGYGRDGYTLHVHIRPSAHPHRV